MDISVKEDILERLKENRSFHRTSLSQYAMRCCLCGDSRKDPSKTRLYFKINTNDESPILYMCFNCDSYGILTPDMLRSMDIYDPHINSRLVSFNKESTKAIRKKLGCANDSKLNVKVPIPEHNQSNINKLKYVSKRLGIDFTFDELVKLKCVFSLKEFVYLNNISKLTVANQRAITLNNDYVGFLTVNNEFINFRDITNKNKLRYDKYTIVPDLPDTTKMYIIPTKFDLLTTNEVNVNICEGVFDALGIYYHINNEKSVDNLYIAVCGSGYMNVIKYIVKLGLIGDNVTINIFSDSDRNKYFYNKVFGYASSWFGCINLYYNTLEKDYGVTKDKINLVKYVIKQKNMPYR